MIDSSIEAKEILFKELFDAKFLFQIPGYQRPFSWEVDNFEQLFEDIKQALENEEETYFLGSVILQVKKQEADGSGIYDIVDGQQRLTTLTILLAVMRDLVSNSDAKNTLQGKIYQKANEYVNTPEQVRLLVRERERIFFRELILEKDGTTKEIQNNSLNESQKHMVYAIRLFREKFIKDGQIQEDLLNQMIKYILNNCVFVYVKTGNFTSAFRLFSVLNDRGMPLTNSDLLKSVNLGAIIDSEREYYQRIWDISEEELGRDQFDQLLGHIRTIFVKDKARKSIFDEYEQIIFKKNPQFKGKWFINYLNKISEIYMERVLNADLSSGNNEINVKYFNLISLMRDYIPVSDWIPVFISFSMKFSNQTNSLTYDFLLNLEKLVIVQWILGITPNARIVEMNKLLSLIESSQSIEEVLNYSSFDTNVYLENVEKVLNSSEFYNKKYSKYLLLRLDMSLSENTNVLKAYKGTVSIEHVLPQKPSEEWTYKFSEQEMNEWTHRVGNLVLLSKKKNSSANNKPFHEKIKKYYSNKGITDFEITKEIKKYDDWNIEVLNKRQQELIERFISMWIS